MTSSPKPGNQPDPADMANLPDNKGEAHDVPAVHPNLEAAEEEAARLGDFA